MTRHCNAAFSVGYKTQQAHEWVQVSLKIRVVVDFKLLVRMFQVSCVTLSAIVYLLLNDFSKKIICVCACVCVSLRKTKVCRRGCTECLSMVCIQLLRWTGCFQHFLQDGPDYGRPDSTRFDHSVYLLERRDVLTVRSTSD